MLYYELSLFLLARSGVTPKWEDPCCEKGGRWTVTLPKSNAEELTNEIWLNALLSCIGITSPSILLLSV